jgi:hypothetical protein
MERGLKSKAHWDSFGHKVFCEICKEEVGAGNRPVSYLNKTGYKNLQHKFLARTGRSYERKQFKNRWESLKKEYAHWVAFTQAATGQRWHSASGTVDADNEWWVKLTEVSSSVPKSNGVYFLQVYVDLQIMLMLIVSPFICFLGPPRICKVPEWTTRKPC